MEAAAALVEVGAAAKEVEKTPPYVAVMAGEERWGQLLLDAFESKQNESDPSLPARTPAVVDSPTTALSCSPGLPPCTCQAPSNGPPSARSGGPLGASPEGEDSLAVTLAMDVVDMLYQLLFGGGGDDGESWDGSMDDELLSVA